MTHRDLPHYANLRDGELAYPEAQRVSFWVAAACVIVAAWVVGFATMASVERIASSIAVEVQTSISNTTANE